MTVSHHLNPTNDIAFKRVFGNKHHQDILIKFLNDLLEKKLGELIVSLEFINPNFSAEFASDKQSILDVFVTDEKGTRYIVEMQVDAQPGFEKRAQYYAAKAYCSQSKRGDKYADLSAVVFLAIVDFNFLKDETAYISQHVILDKKTHKNHLKDFSFTFVELKKFHKTFEELETDEDRWCFFLKNADKEALMQKLVKTSDPIFEKAYNELAAHNWSDADILLYEQEEKNLMDARNRLYGAEQKGLEKGLEAGLKQGRQEGRQEEKINMAKAALQEGLPIHIVAKLTGLTEAEINQL